MYVCVSLYWWLGEVKSDEEATAGSEAVETRDSHSRSRGVQDAVVDVLRVLDKEAAAQAITQLVQTFSCLSDLAQSQGWPTLLHCDCSYCVCVCVLRGCDGGR